MINSNYYESDKYKDCTWNELYEFYKTYCTKPGENWIFRGQAQPGSNNHDFETSLEKAIECFEINKDQTPHLESCLLWKFKRQLHHYGMHIPRDREIVDWFALMQHYGAPTRLLDWTYSFFVSVFFAMGKAKNKNKCDIWALNTKSKDPNDPKPLIIDLKSNQALEIFKKRELTVYSISPNKLNERLIIQQGSFLCPGDVSKSFDDNFNEFLSKSNFSKDNLIKLTIKSDDITVKKEIFRHLHRMNINEAVLFPGLVGFAESLETLLLFPDILTADPTLS